MVCSPPLGPAVPGARIYRAGMSRRDRAWRALWASRGDLACIVVALFLGGLATDATAVDSGAYAPANALIGLAAVGALLRRRRFPRAVAVVTFVASAAAPLAGGAAIMSVYTLASRLDRRQALAVTSLSIGPGVVGMVVFPDQESGQALSALIGLLLTVAAFGWGYAVRTRSLLVESLQERARRAELDQHARVLEARKSERARIATEMHDVLAHRLSMLSIHAGAIETRPTGRPDDIARSAGIVRSNAHLALEELRAVIGVLRDEASEDLAPLPTAADIGALVAECRDAGMRIDVTAVDTHDIPPDLGRHAYRVAQEALTNARKHAPGRPVRFQIAGRAGAGLTIEVDNEMAPDAITPVVPGAGLGLAGLRERVELLGGTVDSGPLGARRHVLRVWLPWA